MSNRRDVMIAIGGALAAPQAVWAQQPKVARIGFLYQASRQSAQEMGRIDAFMQGMRDLGYVSGVNFVLDERYADGKIERLPALAAEMVNAKMDVIVATGGPVYRVLRQATSSIPIIITVTSDPIVEGYAKSLAQPGNNFTGFMTFADELGSKLLEFLKATVPRFNHLGVLLNPSSMNHPSQLVKLMVVSQKIGVRVWVAEAGTTQEIETQISAMAKNGVHGMIILNDTFYVDQLRHIATQALRNKLPSITAIREYASVGGLMSYGANLTDNFRRAATYVDKILKGAKAGTLPFEAPMRFYLEINGKTAKALGLTIPPTVMVRTEKVIE